MSQVATGVYKHSGRLGTGLILLPIVGLIAAVVLGAAYAYIDLYSPIAGYVSLLFVGGLAFGLGWTIAKAGHVAKCRNSGFLALAGLVSGLVALYSSWAAFIFAFLSRYAKEFNAGVLDVYLSPNAIWQMVLVINEEGWYEMFGGTPKGTGLWVMWGIEAAIIVIGTVLFSMMNMDEKVFCEDCNQWCDKPDGPAVLEIPQDASVLETLTPENVDSLAQLEGAPAESEQYIRVDGWKCSACDRTSAIQAKIAKIVVDKEGKASEEAQELTEVWLVETAAHDHVMRERPVKPVAEKQDSENQSSVPSFVDADEDE